MKVKFNDSENYITLQGWVIGRNMVTLLADGIRENLSGFILYDDDERTVLQDYSDYVYRWDIYTEKKDQITFTNSETDRQGKPALTEMPKEIVDPLSNEELTEIVADLMYEVSAAQLGL
ncbi:MAG: hypothetical protein K2K90_05255 [Lachnospiraceae bacterium]|nr:hypothetical protein [Lachnospiraceae bacterium]